MHIHWKKKKGEKSSSKLVLVCLHSQNPTTRKKQKERVPSISTYLCSELMNKSSYFSIFEILKITQNAKASNLIFCIDLFFLQNLLLLSFPNIQQTQVGFPNFSRCFLNPSTPQMVWRSLTIQCMKGILNRLKWIPELATGHWRNKWLQFSSSWLHIKHLLHNEFPQSL